MVWFLLFGGYGGLLHITPPREGGREYIEINGENRSSYWSYMQSTLAKSILRIGTTPIQACRP